MTEANPTMTRIARGIELGQQGDRAGARELFTTIWDEIGPGGVPLYRCTVAHSMADVQDDVHDELDWDLRALDAADSITDDQLARVGMSGSAQGFYPSLHLNLAEAYRKLGEFNHARDHLERGYGAADALGDDGYGRMIKGGLDRLAGRLAV